MTSPARLWIALLALTAVHSCGGVPAPSVELDGTYEVTWVGIDDRLLGGTIHIEGDDLTILFTDAEANRTYAVRYERNVADD